MPLKRIVLRVLVLERLIDACERARVGMARERTPEQISSSSSSLSRVTHISSSLLVAFGVGQKKPSLVLSLRQGDMHVVVGFKNDQGDVVGVKARPTVKRCTSRGVRDVVLVIGPDDFDLGQRSVVCEREAADADRGGCVEEEAGTTGRSSLSSFAFPNTHVVGWVIS